MTQMKEEGIGRGVETRTQDEKEPRLVLDGDGWDDRARHLHGMLSFGPRGEPRGPAIPLGQPVRAVTFLDEETLAAGDDHGRVALVRGEAEVGGWSAHAGPVEDLFILRSPDRLATRGADGFVRVWTPAGELLREHGPFPGARALAVQEESEELAL